MRGEASVYVVFGILSKAIQELEPNVVGQRLPGTTDDNVLDVEDALWGSAFAVAQAHMKTLTVSEKPLLAGEINAIANYWKHRNEWKVPWRRGRGQGEVHPNTFDIVVTRLGEAGPVTLGQLTRMAKRVKGNLGLWQLFVTSLPDGWPLHGSPAG